MITSAQIKEKLSEAIKQSNLNQKEIGEKLGISQQTVSHYINGDRVPSLDMFANLCNALDLDPAEILCLKL